jgi:phosphoribosylglycinamide formyltransferase-1
VVLASGNGSNLQAIIDKLHGRQASPDGPLIEVVLVLSDQPGARALERAKQAGIATAVCAVASAGTREAQEACVLEAVSKAAPDLVVLAGYMRIVPPAFVRAFSQRIINLHPALLPAFPGTASIEDALEHGVKVTGVTVHFVDEGLDTGPIITQEAVAVEGGDSVETLADRIHSVEHELLPATIREIAQGKVKPPLPGKRVVQVD